LPERTCTNAIRPEVSLEEQVGIDFPGRNGSPTREMRTRIGFDTAAPDPGQTAGKNQIDDKATVANEVKLDIEGIVEVIAPKVSANHNQTVVFEEAIQRAVEDIEDVTAPKIGSNHNETNVSDSTAELVVEQIK